MKSSLFSVADKLSYPVPDLITGYNLLCKAARLPFFNDSLYSFIFKVDFRNKVIQALPGFDNAYLNLTRLEGIIGIMLEAIRNDGLPAVCLSLSNTPEGCYFFWETPDRALKQREIQEIEHLLGISFKYHTVNANDRSIWFDTVDYVVYGIDSRYYLNQAVELFPDRSINVKSRCYNPIKKPIKQIVTSFLDIDIRSTDSIKGCWVIDEDDECRLITLNQLLKSSFDFCGATIALRHNQRLVNFNLKKEEDYVFVEITHECDGLADSYFESIDHSLGLSVSKVEEISNGRLCMFDEDRRKDDDLFNLAVDLTVDTSD